MESIYKNVFYLNIGKYFLPTLGVQSEEQEKTEGIESLCTVNVKTFLERKCNSKILYQLVYLSKHDTLWPRGIIIIINFCSMALVIVILNLPLTKY